MKLEERDRDVIIMLIGAFFLGWAVHGWLTL